MLSCCLPVRHPLRRTPSPHSEFKSHYRVAFDIQKKCTKLVRVASLWSLSTPKQCQHLEEGRIGSHSG